MENAQPVSGQYREGDCEAADHDGRGGSEPCDTGDRLIPRHVAVCRGERVSHRDVYEIPHHPQRGGET